MKKRSEMRKRSESASTPETEAPKTSAAARTPDMFQRVSRELGSVHCKACGESSLAKGASTRDDGTVECPRCGAPIPHVRIVEPKGAPEPGPIPGKSTEPLPKAFCDECGAKWARVDGRPWPNCGHDKGFVDDPAKARRYSPPAGQSRVAPAELEERRSTLEPRQPAEGLPARAGKTSDPAREPAHPVTVASSPRQLGPETRLVGTRIHVGWGKASFPVFPGKFGSFNTPDIDVYLDVPEGVDPADVASVMIPSLEKVASEAFDRMLTWYLSRLDVIADKVGD